MRQPPEGDSDALSRPLERPVADAEGQFMDLLTDDLIETFAEEAGTYLEQIGALLRQLEADPSQRSLLRRLWQLVHTVKGTAGILGLQDLSRLAHRMEDLLRSLDEGASALDEPTLRLLFATTDTLTDVVSEGVGKLGASSARLTKAFEGYDRLLAGSVAGGSSPADDPTEPAPAVPGDLAAPTRPGEGSSRLQESQRVPVARLDEMARLAGELGSRRVALDLEIGELGRLVGELRSSLVRMASVSHRLESELGANRSSELPSGSGQEALALSAGREFDALEMDRYTDFDIASREWSEARSDVETVGDELGEALRRLQEIRDRNATLTNEFQDRLLRLRMVPFADLAGRLHRTVRATAEQQGKKVALRLQGESVEIDKSVIEAVAEPLLHLLRNAVVHGIEPPAARLGAGKPDCGTIRIELLQEGPEVVVRIVDDGAGLDLERIRSRAVELGLMTPSAAADATASTLRQLIFRPGFSTAREVSEVSGRGVGLDSVMQTVGRLRGSIEVRSQRGHETAFIIHLPLTLALTQALLVESGGESLAIPLAPVVQARRMHRDELAVEGDRHFLSLDERKLPLIDLAAALRLPQTGAARRWLQVVELRVPGSRMAILCDRVRGLVDIVVKPIDKLLSGRVRGVSGAGLIGGRKVVLLVDPNDLLPRADEAAYDVDRPRPRDRQLEVLIVDDSLTVRKVSKRVVESAGWRAVLARNGLDALEKLQRGQSRPDVIVLDIEMPRMDGFEFLAAKRHDAVLSRVPTVVVTSRAGEKHRRKAAGLGSADYLVKPYREAELLATIAQAAAQGQAARQAP